MAEDTIIELNQVLVVDKAVIHKLTADQLGDVISQIINSHKAYLVIGDRKGFFNPSTYVNFLKEGDPRANLIGEYLKIPAHIPPQKAVVEVAQPPPVAAPPIPAPAPAPVVNEHGELIVKKALPPNAEHYPFAPVPADWSISKNISLGATKIRRKIAYDGQETDLWLSPDDMKSLWIAASRFWCDMGNAPPAIHIKTSLQVGMTGAYFWPTDIRFPQNGDHRIQRFEIEQIARYRGWEFPDLAAIAA